LEFKEKTLINIKIAIETLKELAATPKGVQGIWEHFKKKSSRLK